MNSYFELSDISQDTNVRNSGYNFFHSANTNLDNQVFKILGKRKTEGIDNIVNSSVENNSTCDPIFRDRATERANVPIWSMDCFDNIVVLGCEDGCLEFWDCVTGKLRVENYLISSLISILRNNCQIC